MGSLIKVAVPEGIGSAMESLTKAILEEQPVDIYKFSYKHFQMKVQRRQEAVGSADSPLDEDNTRSKESTTEENKDTPTQPHLEELQITAV
uniref:Uncharacterized protein n=1 Tax=Rhodnius prolixus TaxID=13249 RepID=T1HLT5_RHOPR